MRRPNNLNRARLGTRQHSMQEQSTNNSDNARTFVPVEEDNKEKKSGELGVEFI